MKINSKKESARVVAAKGFFDQYNCCQAVLLAFADELPFEEKSLLRLTAGMGGGMCRGAVCGAVSAACMIVGSRQQFRSGNQEEKAQLKAEVRRFYTLFQEKCGALDCKDLIGFDLNIPEEAEKARAAGAFDQMCPNFVASSVQIIEEHF